MADQLMYKGYPLVRCNNELYYGNPTDTHVVFIQILDTEEQDGVAVATKTRVQLVSNTPVAGTESRVKRESDKQGLYNALDIGAIWLKRALTEKK